MVELQAVDRHLAGDGADQVEGLLPPVGGDQGLDDEEGQGADDLAAVGDGDEPVVGGLLEQEDAAQRGGVGRDVGHVAVAPGAEQPPALRVAPDDVAVVAQDLAVGPQLGDDGGLARAGMADEEEALIVDDHASRMEDATLMIS